MPTVVLDHYSFTPLRDLNKTRCDKASYTLFRCSQKITHNSVRGLPSEVTERPQFRTHYSPLSPVCQAAYTTSICV